MSSPDLQEQDRRARLQIQKQMTATQATLDALVRAGLAPHHVVSLDFSFVAPDRARADLLRAHLERNHCLDVSVDPIDEAESGRADPAAPHAVSGRSHPTKLSGELLNQWVPWMVVQGVRHECEFDGWSTQVPGAT